MCECCCCCAIGATMLPVVAKSWRTTFAVRFKWRRVPCKMFTNKTLCKTETQKPTPKTNIVSSCKLQLQLQFQLLLVCFVIVLWFDPQQSCLRYAIYR